MWSKPSHIPRMANRSVNFNHSLVESLKECFVDEYLNPAKVKMVSSQYLMTACCP
jgi:hypothetical protein